MIPSTFLSSPVPLEAKQPQSIMLPPPCFTVGMVFFGQRHMSSGVTFRVVLGLLRTIRANFSSKAGDNFGGHDCVRPKVLYLSIIVATDCFGIFNLLEIPPNDDPRLWKSMIRCHISTLYSLDFPIFAQF